MFMCQHGIHVTKMISALVHTGLTGDRLPRLERLLHLLVR